MKFRTLAELERAIEHVSVQLYDIPGGGEFSDKFINSMLISVGMSPRDYTMWTELSADDVRRFLVHHVGHDLAYHTNQLESEERCVELAEALLGRAGEGYRWFANHSASLEEIRKGSYSWDPISSWTFDLGYIAIGESHSFLVCFLAED